MVVVSVSAASPPLNCEFNGAAMNILPSKETLRDEYNWSDNFVLEQFLPFRLNRIALELTRLFSGVYQEQYGLDIPEWLVLGTLANGEPITAQSVVDLTHTHKSTVSRAVASLIERGWVERLTSTEDRRAQLIRFTTEGRAAFTELLSRMLERQEEVQQLLGTRGARSVNRAMDVMEQRFLNQADCR